MGSPLVEHGGPTRQRLITTALELFKLQSVAGTSLQMISDELGLTKSAIYHHFRTRDELLSAVVEPVITELAAAVEAAEGLRGPRVRADHMLSGYAELAASNRDLFSVLSGDPVVVDLLSVRTDWGSVLARLTDLLAGAQPGIGGRVKATIIMAGFSAAGRAAFDELNDAALRDHLLEAGRRTLGLRAPRRPR